MMITPWLEIFGQIGIAAALLVLGLISRRLGSATRAKPQFIGFFIAAALLLTSAVVRALNLIFGLVPLGEVPVSFGWVMLYNGLPALGITLGVIFSWHYWSWLLAERD